MRYGGSNTEGLRHAEVIRGKSTDGLTGYADVIRVRDDPTGMGSGAPSTLRE